jgi:hypothetical protein
LMRWLERGVFCAAWWFSGNGLGVFIKISSDTSSAQYSGGLQQRQLTILWFAELDG